MIVYGDPGQEREIGQVLEALWTRCDGLADSGNLDGTREFLIEAGRVEQGLADVRSAPAAERLTDAAAEQWLRVWRGEMFGPEACRESLRQLEGWRGERVYMKVPEGFAFYTLYPEQYALGAERWAGEARAAGRRVLVVGIRSIGTTLSAVVAATLRRCGCEVQRVTVRPTGHPYDRRAEVDAEHVRNAEWALIVDEGPGRSGSSFVAVGRALANAGVKRERIVFFPGHDGMPGEDGTGETCAWWRETRRVNVGMEEVRWGGRSLCEELARETHRRMGAGRSGAAEGIRFEDLSGGRWREVLGIDAPAWGAFERTKFRAVLPDGRAVLWKFAGLDGGAARAAEALRSRAAWAAPCIGDRLGFVGTLWIHGRALRAAEVRGEDLSFLATYLQGASREHLTQEEAAQSLQRLRAMASCNCAEAFGEAQGKAIDAWADSLGGRLLEERRTAPDGRMGPWEWIRAGHGKLVKVDAQGHGVDHTCIGRQSLWWDVAGTIVEWELDSSATGRFLGELGLADGEVARWFCAAYAAFRAGMSAMCGTRDARYRSQLLLLTSLPD